MKIRSGFVSNSSSSSFLVTVEAGSEVDTFLTIFAKVSHGLYSDNSICVYLGESWLQDRKNDLAQYPDDEDLQERVKELEELMITKKVFCISTPYGAEETIIALKEFGLEIIRENY